MHYEQDSDYQRADTSVIIDPYSDYQYINEVRSDVSPFLDICSLSPHF